MPWFNRVDHLVLKLPTGTKGAGAVLLGSGEVHVEGRDVAGGPLDLRSRHGEAVCGPQVARGLAACSQGGLRHVGECVHEHLALHRHGLVVGRQASVARSLIQIKSKTLEGKSPQCWPRTSPTPS